MASRAAGAAGAAGSPATTPVAGAALTRAEARIRLQCPHHPTASLVEDFREGNISCADCGRVVCDRIVDTSSERRTFGDSRRSREDPSRVGGVGHALLDGRDLSTGIINLRGGALGTDFRSTQTLHARTQLSSADRSLLKAFRLMGDMAGRLNIPKKITSQAEIIYKAVCAAKKNRGRKTESLVAACLYIACRQMKAARSVREVVAATAASTKRDIDRCYRHVVKVLEAGDVEFKKPQVLEAVEFMQRWCVRLGLVRRVQDAAKFAARKAKALGIVEGRSPISVAAAAIYMLTQASKNKRTPRQVGDVCGVSESAIISSYKDMYPCRQVLFKATYVMARDALDRLPFHGAPERDIDYEGILRAELEARAAAKASRSARASGKAAGAAAAPT